MIIYVFGNPLVKEDSLPIKLIPWLKKKFPVIQFIITDPNENFPPEEENDPIILDTVKGIDKPTLLNLEDLMRIKKTPVSPHDYDLLMHLLLLRKLKKISSAKIIGVPNNEFKPEELIKIITSILP